MNLIAGNNNGIRKLNHPNFWLTGPRRVRSIQTNETHAGKTMSFRNRAANYINMGYENYTRQ